MIHNCQFCHKRILTETDHETTWVGILISIIFFLIFKLYAFILIVLIIPLTQQTNHRCPSCLNVVGVHSFYDLVSLKDRVFSFNFGNFALIINRKQLLAIFFFILLSLSLLITFKTVSFTKNTNFLNVDWNKYQLNCNKEKFRQSPHSTHQFCNTVYQYQSVSWKGWVIRIDYEERLFNRFRSQILVKMDRNEDEDADIYLKFEDHIYREYKGVILNMTRGDQIEFNATILFTGDQDHVSIFECFGVEKQNDHIFINPHIHHNGRYSVEEKHSHKNEALFNELPGLVLDNETDITQLETNN